MKSNNYIQIQGWMVTKLNLTGNCLLAYALIYGFSQDGQSEFTGSINYVCKWLGCSRSTAIKVLKELTEKNLIDKNQIEINNVTFNKYSANLTSAGTFERGSAESTPPVQNTDRGSAKTTPGGSAKTTPNNTTYNKLKNNDSDVYLAIDSLKDAYLEDPKIISSLIRQNTFKSKDAVETRLEEFNDFLTARGQYMKTWKDYTSHFLNWHKKNKNGKTVSFKSPTDVTL